MQYTVLVCNSNMFVPYVMTEALSHPENNYLILSDIDNMVRFLEEIRLSNSIIIKFRQPESWKDRNKARRELLEAANKFDINRIIFFHAEFGGIINWFLLKMSKRTDIYYCKVFNSLPYPKARGIKAFKYWVYNYAFYGVRMVILDNNPYLAPSLPKSFYIRVGAKPYVISADYSMIKIALTENLKDINFNAKVVMLTGSTVAEGYVNEVEYIKKTDELIEAIGENNCVAKCHPRFNDVFSKELVLPTIPSYIPGNLIIGNFGIFISNHSTLLVEAAMAGKTAISLIEYYKQTNDGLVEHIKTFYKDRLMDRGSIFYPKTKEEVLSIIRKVSSL